MRASPGFWLRSLGGVWLCEAAIAGACSSSGGAARFNTNTGGTTGSSGAGGNGASGATGGTTNGGSAGFDIPPVALDSGSDSGSLLGTPQPPAPTAIPAGGDVFGTGTTAADKPTLEGTPDGAATPTVVYPLAHSLFPANMAPVEIHLTKAVAAQAVARIAFHVDGGAAGNFDLNVYGQCAPAELDATTGCVLTIPADVCKKLGDANSFGTLTTTIRLAAAAGGSLGETKLDDVSWTYSILTGGLYYWSTAGTTGTAIKRYDFDKATMAPEIYWRQNPDSPAVVSNTYKINAQHACVGCHSITRDGNKIALTFGGSLPAAFELVDVASKQPIIQKLDGDTGYATMTTFSPDGTRMINSYKGELLLRSADANAQELGTLFAADTQETKSHAFWSPTGNTIAFVSYLFAATTQDPIPTGDVVQNGQIWVAPSDGKVVTGPAKVIVPRSTDAAYYYPAISDDGKFVVYNTSSCAGPPGSTGDWGAGACDGYNDFSGRLSAIPIEGGTPVDLARANGDAAQSVSNQWPRWSPDHGAFQKRTVYWVAFSSRRGYGLRIAGGAVTGQIKPQLWFTAVRLSAGGTIEGDPSFAPVWLPGQNESMTAPTGNHTPQWVLRAVPVQIY